MIECGRPDWALEESAEEQAARRHAAELRAAYALTAKLCEARCAQLAQSGRRNADGRLCDDYGTIDEYRMDAKYCAGSATRDTPHQEAPTDPRSLARWAWENPWREMVALPPPRDALLLMRPHEMLEKFTQRQAEALILVEGLRMKHKDAARVMGCRVERIREYLLDARRKFGPNEDANNV